MWVRGALSCCCEGTEFLDSSTSTAVPKPPSNLAVSLLVIHAVAEAAVQKGTPMAVTWSMEQSSREQGELGAPSGGFPGCITID